VDSIVKQRLVGGLILLALGVVFWPIIFVPEARRGSSIDLVVPPPPPVNEAPLAGPDSVGLRSPEPLNTPREPVPDVLLPEELDANGPAPALPARADTVREMSLDDARETLTEPVLDADGLPIAFTLQVATMGSRERAEALRDELVEAGYKGYVKRLRREDKVLYRVLVGPKFRREELDAIKTGVDEAWRVESLIMRYYP
jgi:DedD protein